jgi:cell division protease FtsH
MFLLLIFVAYMFMDTANRSSSKTHSITELYSEIQNENVQKIEVGLIEGVSGAGVLKVTLKDGQSYSVDVVSIESHESKLAEMSETYGFDYYTQQIKRPNIFSELFVTVISMTLVFVIIFVVFQQMQGSGGGSKYMNFGKTRVKLVSSDKMRVKFDDVAGLDEEKYELQEIVDFLKNPRKYIDVGARIPKGVLLVGPPGTGKTLLAKAVAGEAAVPFFSMSGSDFVEMFVGVGASRVRDLFETAKKNLPCIVFIDEIDAVGRKRGAGLGGGHDEREQTLNQLLVEMDGFGVNEGIIIIAATNRHDILDPALLRPGRFDRHVSVGIPDVKGREGILKVHARDKKIAEDVDFKNVALSTSGFTGADLENLLNEAALLAARDNKKEITMEEVRRAFIKVGFGTEKKSRVVTDKERKLTAYHEAGHGIIHEVLPELDPVNIISIIPTGFAGGYTMPIPSEEKNYSTKRSMQQSIVSLLGGRAAEEIILDDISTGASNDIERASKIARNMVMRYGMSEKLGPIAFGSESEELFIGREISQGRNYGEEIATEIDLEVRNIVEGAHKTARKVLNDYIEVLHKAAKLLMEKEKITGEEFRDLFPPGTLTKSINEGFLNPQNA